VLALALLLCSLTVAADPPGPPPPEAPQAAPATGGGEATAPAAAPAETGSPPVEPSTFEHFAWGFEGTAPRKQRGRLLEQPLSLVMDGTSRLTGPFEWGARISLGYAQLSRTEACTPEAFCAPLGIISAGAVIRATTAPGRAAVGWIGLGAGINGGGNWDLNLGGGYARADAGVDLGAGARRVRLSVGWVVSAWTEDRSELEPGRQQYLAFTLLVGSR
jgi:hypothetical protein